MGIHLTGKLDGVQTAEIIHKTTDVPIIYLTAYADKELLDRAKQTELYWYLTKPYYERDLHSIIEMARSKYTIDRKRLGDVKKYRALTENTADILFSTKIAGVITYVYHKSTNMVFVKRSSSENPFVCSSTWQILIS